MTTPNPKNSGARNRPSRGLSPGFVIKDRDIEILKLVYAHRFLDTELIWHLLEVRQDDLALGQIGANGKQRPARYGFGMKALYKRLQGLFKKRYLVRHYATDQPMRRGHGSPRAIYGLGTASAKVLPDVIGESPEQIRRIVESNKVKSPFLRHALGIARFRAILELACRNSGNMAKLLFWEQGQVLSDIVYGRNPQGEEERLSVYPDACFGLAVSGKGNACYFLEVDRGTMPIIASGSGPDIRKKASGYWHYRKTKKYSDKYFYVKLPDGQVGGLAIKGKAASNQLGAAFEPIRGFTALFLVPGKLSRSGNPSGRLANILAEFPRFGKNLSTSSLFWLSSPHSFSVERPESIFSKAWITPNPQKGIQSLIE